MRGSVEGPSLNFGEWVTMPNGVRLQRKSRFTLHVDPADPDVPEGLEGFEVALDMGKDGTDPRVEVLAINATPDGSVRGEHLRYIASSWDRQLVPFLVQRAFFAATESGGGPVGKGPNVAASADFAVKRARRSELTPEVLQEVAAVHRDETHYARCDRPQCQAPILTSAERVAAHFHLSKDGANTRIRRARQAGYLKPVQRKGD